jgi:hypothetical protein
MDAIYLSLNPIDSNLTRMSELPSSWCNSHFLEQAENKGVIIWCFTNDRHDEVWLPERCSRKSRGARCRSSLIVVRPLKMGFKKKQTVRVNANAAA